MQQRPGVGLLYLAPRGNVNDYLPCCKRPIKTTPHSDMSRIDNAIRYIFPGDLKTQIKTPLNLLCQRIQASNIDPVSSTAIGHDKIFRSITILSIE